MKVFIASLAGIILVTGCASPSGGNSKAPDSKAIAAVKPTPTPRPTPVDDSVPYNTNSQVVVGLSKDETWKRIVDIEKWADWVPAVKESKRMGGEIDLGSSLNWTFGQDVIESTVIGLEDRRSMKIKGTPAGVEATMEFVLRPMGPNQALVAVNCQMPPGWGKKDKERKLQMKQLQEFLKALQQLK